MAYTPISVVIITYNEERNIGRCLESVKEIADDIVVVDSFSNDNTKAICLANGVRFIEHVFEGHIEQKNWAITQALYPHVLSLDADEALDETLKESILRVKQNFTKAAYSMNRLTNYCGHWIKHCGWYPDIKLRLWDSRCGSWGGDNPHDKYELHTRTDEVGHLRGNILHYSYYTEDEHHSQVEYFTSILAQSQFKRGKKAPLLVMYLSPVVKFIKDYIIKLGFLDGAVGFKICRISAHATYIKYRKLRTLHQMKGKLTE
jgi:glycosyltransferase involved in cell wall biosynthesis